MTQPRTIVVDPESAGQRIDRFLSEVLTGRSRSCVQKLIEDQHVLVDGKSARVSYRVRAGERIEVLEPPPVAAEPRAEFIPLVVLYEDPDLMVLDKAAGLVVHPAPGSPDGTLVNALLHRCRDLSGIGGVLRPGIVHRLDRNTSGLLVVAKNDLAHQALSRQFQEHTVAKRYLAWAVERPGQPPIPGSGVFDTLYARHPVHRKRFSSKVARGKRAVTRFQVVRRWSGSGWAVVKVQLDLETGRTHQIRAHLADAGHPILGDKLYGGRSGRGLPPGISLDRQALHAWQLVFHHPRSGEELRFEADLPADLQQLELFLTGLQA